MVNYSSAVGVPQTKKNTDTGIITSYHSPLSSLSSSSFPKHKSQSRSIIVESYENILQHQFNNDHHEWAASGEE